MSLNPLEILVGALFHCTESINSYIKNHGISDTHRKLLYGEKSCRNRLQSTHVLLYFSIPNRSEVKTLSTGHLASPKTPPFLCGGVRLFSKPHFFFSPVFNNSRCYSELCNILPSINQTTVTFLCLESQLYFGEQGLDFGSFGNL